MFGASSSMRDVILLVSPENCNVEKLLISIVCVALGSSLNESVVLIMLAVVVL